MRQPPEPTQEGSCLDALRALPTAYYTVDQIRFKIAELTKLDATNAPSYDTIFRTLNNLVETQQLELNQLTPFTFSFRWRNHQK